jgi:flagella synthesis protein FlgN
MVTPLARLLNCMQQELALVQEFIVALKAEETALTDLGNDAALSDSTARKNMCADQLAAIGQEREALLASLGYSADKAGMDAAARQHPELQAVWDDLYRNAQQASELNASNGVMIDTFLAHNQQAMSTLKAIAGISDLYDASGRSKSTGPAGQTRTIRAG